ncbi:MAG: DUF748 domain-containing protein [Cytophaga sp.]|uniref:DUF748 domain-containing protein n=1 Tax=Cytophaga sp. TaxID=29535 RepID=UPI003F7FF0CB
MSFFKNLSKKKKIVTITLSVIIVGLIIFRLLLPTIVKNYLNKTLADMGEYSGHVNDVDIWLIRGAYVINGLEINKTSGKVPVPFLIAPVIDLSVEWKALFKGAVKAKVTFDDPELTFVAGPTKETSQTGAGTDWTEPLDKLLPIDINKFQIHNGKIKYNDFHASPKVDIFINRLELLATNLSNVEDKEKALPSELIISGSSIGGGNLSLKGHMNVLKQVPDADINMEFTNISLTALNDFAKAYGKFDFEKGKLSIYSEMSVKDANVSGYVKPVLEDVDVLNWDEDGPTFMQKLWQAAVGTTFEVFKNHPKDRFATKIPVEGKLDKKIDTDIFTTVVRVVKNAFIEAYKKSLDDSVSFNNNGEEKEKKFLFFKVKEKKDE